MPTAAADQIIAAILAGVVALVALGLAWRQWVDRGRRDPDPSPADARHFRRQDVRRLLGAAAMLLIAAGLVAGTRIEPGTRAEPNFVWLRIWAGVSLLVLLLLGLALLDWLANRAYALRHRRAIRSERDALIRAELARRPRREGRDDDGPGDGIPRPSLN